MLLAWCSATIVMVAGAQGFAGASVSSASPTTDGMDVRINTPGDQDEQSPICNVQSEVSIARWGDTVVAGWNDGSQCQRLLLRRFGLDDGVGLSLNGFGYSKEGGREGTWTDGGLLKPPQGGRVLGDPVLAAGPAGIFFYATLYACVSSPCQGPVKTLQIGVARSLDGGRSWTVPVDVSHLQGESSLVYDDKPWIAVDTTGPPEEQGDVYVGWTRLDKGRNRPVAVFFSRSDDDGKTFSPPIKLTVPVEACPSTFPTKGECPGTGTQVVAGPDGEVYVAWIEMFSTFYRRIWVARSTNGGEAFEPPIYVATAGLVGHPQDACSPAGNQDPHAVLESAPGWIHPDDPEATVTAVVAGAQGSLPFKGRLVINGDIRIGNWISMAVDVSGSHDPASPTYNPYRGNLYLAVPHDPESLNPIVQWRDFVANAPAPYGDESDIAFTYSEDRGTTWNNIAFDETVLQWVPTFVVNDDLIGDGERTRTDQFHPQVAVDSRGRVAVSWYDRRADPWNLDMEIYAAVSTDGGRTFGDNFPVSDESFPPARTNPNTGAFDGCYMGEYNGMVAGDDEFLLAWGDNRDGPEAHPDPNVYFDHITFPDTGGEGDVEAGPEGGTADGTLPGNTADDDGAPGAETGTEPGVGGGLEAASYPTSSCDDPATGAVIGTPKRDVLRGTPGPDILCGLGGRDRLVGLRGDDLIIGGPGHDLLDGGHGVDVCFGGPGRDRARQCETDRL